MDRLFLDANILFSAAYRADAGLLEFWKLKNVVLCSSRYAWEEAKINLIEDAQHQRLAKLAAGIHFFDAVPRTLSAQIALPEKDMPILLAALEASATHLITGDIRHFGRYFETMIEGITVLTARRYLELHGWDTKEIRST